MNSRISLLFDSSKHIFLNFSLFPILTSSFSHHFDYLDLKKPKLPIDNNSIVLVFAKLIIHYNQEEKEIFFKGLKDKYKKLIFFDDLDGSEIQYFQYWKYFDLYFKKQLYSDKNLYSESFQGDKIFSDYYSKFYKTKTYNYFSCDSQFKGDPISLQKLHLSWNIGLGTYPSPNSKLVRAVFSLFGQKGLSIYFSSLIKKKFQNPIKLSNKCHARFAYNPDRKHIDFQRKLFLEIIEQNPNFLAGKVSKNEYQRELKEVKAVLSPFGFGEICFRDFEAVINGSALVKPDMSHLTTWPNLYIPNETYIPVDWSGNDLIQKVDLLLSDQGMMTDLTKTSQAKLLQAYQDIDLKVKEFLDLIYS